MRDVKSAIISHEQTQSNRACCFQTLDAVFSKNLFSDYLNRNQLSQIIYWRVSQVIVIFFRIIFKISVCNCFFYAMYLAVSLKFMKVYENKRRRKKFTNIFVRRTCH